MSQKACICDDREVAMMKFMYGWRYCAYCGDHLQTKIQNSYKGEKK